MAMTDGENVVAFYEEDYTDSRHLMGNNYAKACSE